MGPTWVLSAPDGPDVGLMSLAIRDGHKFQKMLILAVRESIFIDLQFPDYIQYVECNSLYFLSLPIVKYSPTKSNLARDYLFECKWIALFR